MRRIAWLVMLAPWLAGCGDPHAGRQRAGSEADVRLGELYDDYWEAHLRENPTRATYIGDHRWDDKLEDLSDAARLESITWRRGLLRWLDSIDVGAASPSNRLSATILRRVLDDDIREAQTPDRFMPVRQQDGPHITLALLKLSQPLQTPEECRRYAKRLTAFPEQVEHAIEQMRQGMQNQMVLPRIIVEKALPQIEAQIKADPSDSELYQAYASTQADRESAARKGLDEELLSATRRAIGGYRKLGEFLRNEYLPACRPTVGICHLPGGREWYVLAARHHTTTDKTPDEIHKIGQREVARIRGEMRAIMAQMKFADDDVSAFCEHLRSRPDLHAASAAELMQGFGEILRQSDANLPRLFGRLPKTPYRLKEIEAFRAAAAPAAYYYAAPDFGTRPAYFYVNTYEPSKRPKYTMEVLAYHEAMPGHHLQIALAQENRSLPMFRRHTGFTVFVEGWALYSECLGRELGGYRDAYSEFGRLTFDMWRACRLVVDTGIHWKAWTREQAIDFMKASTALSELDIENEVDRYIAWPGQALGYKIGQLEIARMRREAESALGPRFDIRAFHDELLAEGALPLDVLQERMAKWVEGQRGEGGGAGNGGR